MQKFINCISYDLIFRNTIVPNELADRNKFWKLIFISRILDVVAQAVNVAVVVEGAVVLIVIAETEEASAVGVEAVANVGVTVGVTVAIAVVTVENVVATVENVAAAVDSDVKVANVDSEEVAVAVAEM